MITITDKARTKLLELQPSVDKFLRIAVVGGGCSGLKYGMSWVDKIELKDIPLNLESFTVVIDDRSIVFLKGLN